MIRDYQRLDIYLNLLMAHIYEQPPDPGHQEAIENIAALWLPGSQARSVLDVGCGQGQAIPVLKQYVDRVVGVTLGTDAALCQGKGLDVFEEDMTFLSFGDASFDLIFARHVLEHSPMPLLTLMEWHRVSRNLLLFVFPSYDHYGASGRNHYYVLLPPQWKNLLEVAGWKIIWEDESYVSKAPFEYRWMCQKVNA